ncbi:hypothetical protein DL96DRAFT_1825393 [Flagelloscypha sp. PMI_526]|nr:hypothetical protein DL96DRAFT_1825393 [Flagelloscypha sp. PMI_526]
MFQSGVLPPLLILQEIASRYEFDKRLLPGSFRANKTFQMIGGVGDGGLLAFMLGHFGIGVTDAIHEYRKILEAVHQHPDAASWSKDERSQKFEDVLKAFVASKTCSNNGNQPLANPKDENPRCKVFVTAMHALNLQHPIFLRSYRSRIDADPPKCTVVEAIRATTAMPDLFRPVTLGPPHRQIDYFSPACHGFNNPIDQVRQEAKAAFPGSAISCIISLGCGHPGPIQIKDVKEDAARAVVQLAMDSVRTAEQTYRRLAGIRNLYFRFDVPYGLERAVLKLNPTLSEIQAHIMAYVGQEQASDRINSAVKQLVERPSSIEASELDGILPVEATATVWVKKCPLPSPNFIGRRDELDHMHAYFSSGVGSTSHIYVIYGLGGSGKTQLQLQFVLECQTRSPRMFDVVFFADASLETTLETDLKTIAIDQKIGETAAGRYDKSFSIQKYIPKSIHGSVIITSRNPELAGLTTKDCGSRQIGDLEKWAAETLLRKLVGSREGPSGDEDSLVTQVVEMLHCFALAVTQAGSYMSATGCGYLEYIEVFQVQRSRLLRERKGHVPDNYPWSVYTTWAVSFDQLKTAPRHFMQICSFLHYTGIPKDLFKCAVEAEPLEDVDEMPQIWLSEFIDHTRNDEGRWNPAAFDEMIENLISFSLVDYDSETRLFSFHPLVHDWTREAIQFTHGQDFPDVQCALQLVALSAPGIDAHSNASVLLKTHLQSHLDSLVQGAVHISSIPMAIRLAAIYDQTGRWNDVANIFERARAINRCDSRWNIERNTSNLAAAYVHLGRHAEALDLQLSVLTNWKQTLGDEHPSTLTSMNNLALTYMNLGRHAESLDLLVSALATQKLTLGDEHPHTLSSMDNLASTYTGLGRHAEALDMQLSALTTRKQTLGSDHPHTLLSMNNIASTYHHLGRHAEALDLQLSTLAAQKRTLGNDHPHTLTNMNNLAGTYHRLERHAEAFDLQRSALATQKQTLGDEHPNTLTSMNNLAQTYTNLRKHAEAFDLQVSVLASRMGVLGDEHPHTLMSMNNLALTYHHLGQHAKALDMQLSALENQKRTLGGEHPDTLLGMNNLASIYHDLGRFAEALDLQRLVLPTQKRTLGDEHPHTLTSMNNLASTYQALGRHAEAIDLLTPAVDIALRVLGAEHSTTLILHRTLERSLMHNSVELVDNPFDEELDTIAATIEQYEKDGRWEDATEHGEVAVETFTAILGEHHPRTLLCMFNLAKNCRRVGRMDDERRHFERMYRIVKDDNFPSEGRLHEVLVVEELYSKMCLGTSTEAHLSLVVPLMNPVTGEPGREMAETLIQRVEDKPSPQARAAGVAESRGKGFDDQSKGREEVEDDKGAQLTTRTENFQNVSVIPPATNFVAAPRTSRFASHVPKRAQETIRKGKARDRSTIPSDQNERTAPGTISTPATGLYVDPPNVEVPSPTLTDQDTVVNEVYIHIADKGDFQELDTSVSSDLVVASTSITPVSVETKAPTEEGEAADSHVIRQNIPSMPPEHEAHERYMAKMEHKNIKIEAKLEKLRIQAKVKAKLAEIHQRQCRLEIARMIFFALVILGIHWIDTKKSRDD